MVQYPSRVFNLPGRVTQYHGIVIKPPPLKVRASQIFSRGFIISQKIWNVSFGVLLFSEISQISDTFRTLFGSFSKHFPLVKQQKVPIFFARASARGFTLKSYFEAFLDLFVEHFPLVNS